MLELQQFVIKERGAFLSPGTWDVFDARTSDKVGVVREKRNPFTRLLRCLLNRRHSPFHMEALETEDESLVFILRQRASLLRPRVEIYDADEHLIGYLACKLLSWASSLWVYDRQGDLFVQTRGERGGEKWIFRTPDGRELALLTKNWTGSGKELLNSPTDYVVAIHADLADRPLAKMLLLGTALSLIALYSPERG